MNRKMNATDSKISALLRSQMMKWLEFRNLVTKVDRFFYDHKLYELMKKTHNREINVLDHKFDFYSILLELLYEVHRNDPYEQPKLLEKVLEWHRTNQDKLKLTRNEAPKGNSVAQLLECKNIQQVIQQRDEVSPKISSGIGPASFRDWKLDSPTPGITDWTHIILLLVFPRLLAICYGLLRIAPCPTGSQACQSDQLLGGHAA
ncbi:uncharacterized protein [Heterodontus francisci]|uniref:uncharacterized protein n=1 Tax=Heterodontus francisci TaxID=7792 RepID=UPI00355B52D4